MEYQPNERDYTLGFIVNNSDLLNGPEIPPGHFKVGHQGEAWSVACELRAAGEEINLVNLASRADGCLGYLNAITSGIIQISPAEFGRRILRERIEDLGVEIRRLAQHEHADDDELAALIEERRRLQLEFEGQLSGAAFRRLAQVEGRSIEWLWQGRIPLGMVSLVAGDPGLGKSFLATWIASRLSVGAALPGDPGPALTGSTIYLSAEDSPAYALRPRAERNGADLEKIIVLENSSFDISSDLAKIRAIVKQEPDTRLVIIDPLNSYLGKTDYLKDPDVRAILNPLVEFCEETRIASLAVMHLNKKTDQAGIYRIGGSIAFAGVARSILAVTQDPDDRDRRFLRPLKMNYARKPDPLAFRIAEDLSLIFDEGPVDVGSDESLTPPMGRDAVEGSFAAEWLADHLAAGPIDLKDILASAKEIGLSRSAVYRAKDRLRLKAKSFGFGKGRSTAWELAHESL
jgi:putative DNA primase/helicase